MTMYVDPIYTLVMSLLHTPTTKHTNLYIEPQYKQRCHPNILAFKNHKGWLSYILKEASPNCCCGKEPQAL
jgi:hypothetical protein